MSEELQRTNAISSLEGSGASAEPSIDLGLEQVLADKYKIEEKIGSGAWGNVYRAEHLRLGTKVAIKTLHFFHAKNDQALLRLEQEAKVLRQVDSTYVIKTLDYGLSPTPFLVMEYFESVPLSNKLAEGKLSEKDVLSIFEQLCQGLKVAHGMGLVHRDLKPSNILLGGEDEVKAKIIDFGLAKVMDTSGATNLTMTGEILGSPPYMAPEQWTNRAVDQRTDIYALGCLIFEAATGKKLFEAQTSFEYLSLHVDSYLYKLDPVHNVHPELAKVILKCVQNQASDRYQSVREILDDLAIIRTGGVVKVKLRKPKRKTANIAQVAAGTMLMLAVVGLVLLVAYRDTIIEKYCESLNNSAKKQAANGKLQQAIETYKASIAWQSNAQNKELYAAKIGLLAILRMKGEPAAQELDREIRAYRNPVIVPAVQKKLDEIVKAEKIHNLTLQLQNAKAALEEAQSSGAPKLVKSICLERLAIALLDNEQKLAAVDKQVEAIALTSSVLGESDPLVAERLLGLAKINFRVPNEDEAEHALLRAVDIAKKEKATKTLHDAYSLLGALSIDTKESAKAVDYFKRAVALNGKMDVSLVDDINSLCQAFVVMNDLSHVHQWAWKAYALPAFNSASASTKASLYLLLASTSLQSSHTDEGIDFLKRAVALEKELPPGHNDLSTAKSFLAKLSARELTMEEMGVKSGYLFLDSDEKLVHGAAIAPSFYCTLDPDVWSSDKEQRDFLLWHNEFAKKIFASFVQNCSTPGEAFVKILVTADRRSRVSKFGKIYPCIASRPESGQILKLLSDSGSQLKFKEQVNKSVNSINIDSLPFPKTKSKFLTYEVNLILGCDADAFPRTGSVDLEYFARRDKNGGNGLTLFHTGARNEKFMLIETKTRPTMVFVSDTDKITSQKKLEELGH